MSNAGYNFGLLKVLIVDDSSYMRSIIKIVLKSIGFRQIYEADDGASALKLLQLNPVDIVLADWEMPIVNGIELVRFIRRSSDGIAPLTPIIMISGHSEIKRIVEARDAGVNEFVVKPLSVQTLYTRLVSIIEKPRPFIKTASFFGPDRRRKVPTNFSGTEQREEELKKLRDLGSSAMGQDKVDSVMGQGER